LVPLEEQRRFLQALRGLVLPPADAQVEVVFPRLLLMRPLAEEESPAARCAAALTLGRLPERRDRGVVSALIAALNDKDPAVARCAAVALNGEQGAGGGAILASPRDPIVEMGADSDAAIPGLVRLIRQESTSPAFSMRSWAVWVLKALGDNGNGNAKSAMADLMNDPSLAKDPNFINAVNF
jgi:HEAT repeat protein